MIVIPLSFLILTTTLCLGAPVNDNKIYKRYQAFVYKKLGKCDASEVPHETRELFGLDLEDPFTIENLMVYEESDVIQKYINLTSEEELDNDVQSKDYRNIQLKNSGFNSTMYPVEEYTQADMAIWLKEYSVYFALLDKVSIDLMVELEQGSLSELPDAEVRDKLGLLRAIRHELKNFWSKIGYKTANDLDRLDELINRLGLDQMVHAQSIYTFAVQHWEGKCYGESD